MLSRLGALCNARSRPAASRAAPARPCRCPLLQASKRGYAFQVRRVFRVFCLILTLALVAGLWIGITTVLGRATISERYDPSNELAVRVKGCDVRVERGTANTVSLNRWRGSGMSQR